MKLFDIFETSLPTVNFVSLFESPKVGREYQHIEDLLILDGAKGGIEAVTELKHIAADPSTMNMKWDGGAAVYWGRGQNGTFMFIPKNQWDKGQQLSKDELATEIESTGRPRQGQSSEDFSQIRKGMANKYNGLWDLFERATPKDFRGYLNGDLMFTEQQQPNEKGYYEFTPNKVTYRVAPNGLYNKMKTAQAFVAVHGKINDFGAEAAGNLQPVPEAEIQKFNQTPGLIVLPTQHPTVKLNPINQEAESALGMIKNNAVAIDTIANFKADKMSGFKKILYDYAVKRAKSNGGLDFAAWLQDCKLSDNQKSIVEKMIEVHFREWDIFWNAFTDIQKLKHDVLDDLHDIHGTSMAKDLGIAAITNGKMGGEGFVKQMASGGMAKLVNPQFRSAPENPRFTPNLNESSLMNNKRLYSLLHCALRDGELDEIFYLLECIDGNKIEFPNMSGLLDENKHGIVKILLRQLKDNTFDDVFINVINVLRKLGATWSELDIIERSIESDIKRINENILTSFFKKKEDPRMANDIAAFINIVKQEADHPGRTAMDIFFKLQTLGNEYGKKLPNCANELNEYKRAIVKVLLLGVKHFGGNFNKDIISALLTLKILGVNWPELEIIDKSVQFDKAHHVYNDHA